MGPIIMDERQRGESRPDEIAALRIYVTEAIKKQ